MGGWIERGRGRKRHGNTGLLKENAKRNPKKMQKEIKLEEEIAW